jgi:peptidyl-prolyl cis-trans isomerase C
MIARRFRLLAVPVIMASIGLGGCSSRLSDAATVTFHDAGGDHTVHISRSELDAELHDLLANARFVQALRSSSLFPNVAGDASTDQELSSRWLTTLVRQTAVDAEAESARVAVTADDTKNATTDQDNSFSQPVFAAFSKTFASKLIDRDARLFAVYRYYQTCPSGRFLSHILVTTQAQADAALARIRAGQKFDVVARALSIDTTSGTRGGALGCLAPGEFVPEFQNAAEAAPLGVVTGPVHTQYGYHLILERRWDPVGDQQFAQALTQAAGAVLTARLKALHVWVNPRYGAWGEIKDANGNTGFAVTAPTVPNPRVCREKSAACTPTTTTTTVPAGG